MRMPAASQQAGRTAFHIMTKPIGPICNLDCKYCFYLEKETFIPKNPTGRRRMTFSKHISVNTLRPRPFPPSALLGKAANRRSSAWISSEKSSR